MTDFPRIFRLRQTFERPRVEDIAGTVRAELARLDLQRSIRPGHTVAITAGSRGIANIVVIIRTLVECLRELGAQPVIIPAMGSHGGGTAEGQLRVLHSYGITEQSCGCPIRSSMETVLVCHSPEGIPVHFDRHAFQCDHVVVCGRVKPHTLFAGPIESGLMKMLLIGLGKCAGAQVYHRAFEDYSFERIVRSVAGEVIARCRVVAGLAIVENAYDETALIEAVPPEDFYNREVQLLALARRWMARLPFQHVDVLLVDRIGKEISGAGLDANVVGRKFNEHKAVEGEFPKVRRICLRGLTAASHGNAIGLGLAEFCRTQLLRDMDPHATRLNAIVSGHIAAGMIPLDYPTDQQMLAAALSTIGLTPPSHAKLLWIADTLHLTELECSEAYLSEAKSREDLEILTPPRPLPLDAEGNLPESVDALASGNTSTTAEHGTARVVNER